MVQLKRNLLSVALASATLMVAMQAQAQTVSAITAAVDETALAADSMSSTITAIRAGTEHVAGEIDTLERGFGDVDDKLNTLKGAADTFSASVAA